MHAPLQEIADLLDHDRAALLAVWDSIPPDLRERRPAPDAWSAAEVLEHLRLTEAGSVALLARRLQRAKEAGLGTEQDLSSRLAALDAHGIDVTGGAPREAPEIVRPSAGVRAAEAESGLRATRSALQGVLADADGLALGDVRLRHVALGEIDFYQWLLFIAGHERRHARQLAAVRNALTRDVPTGSASTPDAGAGVGSAKSS